MTDLWTVLVVADDPDIRDLVQLGPEDAARRSEEIAADAYLPKSFGLAELQAAVK